jgi:hypothetical protein
MKKCSTSLSIKKCKSKLYWDSISPKSECQASRKQTGTNDGEDLGEKEPSYAVVVN